MHTHVRWRGSLLFVVLVVVVVSGPLTSVAVGQSQDRTPASCAGEEHYKSARGLMPPACEVDPDAPVLLDAPTIPFLTPATSVATGSWPQVLAAADLTAAGRSSLAVATDRYFDATNDRTLQLFSSDLAGTLNRSVRLPLGADPAAMLATDVNHDGRLDIVTALAGDNALAVYTNTALPVPLTNPVLLPVPGGPDALTAADLTGDLRPDLVSIVPLSNTIRFWQSSSVGLVPLTRTLSYPTDGYDALDTGDFNSDGLEDLVALRGSGYLTDSVMVAFQRNGTFPLSLTLSPELGGYLPHSLAVGDLNNDGRDDIVVTAGGNTPHTFLNVFLQGPNGLAPTPVTYPAFHLPSAVTVADLNHDGLDDVVLTNDGWRTLGVYLQNAAGTLEPYTVATVPYSSRFRPHALRVADLNGDGGLDVALVGRTAGLTVLLNTQSAPVATIAQPPSLPNLIPGNITVGGTVSTDATSVQVRLRDANAAWITVPVAEGKWQTDLTLPNVDRPYWIEARAVNATTGRIQAPVARQRISISDSCFGLADNDQLSGEPDRLVRFARTTAKTMLIGTTGSKDAHTIALEPGSGQLFSTENYRLGRLDPATAAFSPTVQTFGTGTGSLGKVQFRNPSGLAFVPTTQALYAVQPRGDKLKHNILFQIDPTSGMYVAGAFGGSDYQVISGTAVLSTVNDIAIDPSGTIYAAVDAGKGGSALVQIDPSGVATTIGLFGVANIEGLTFAGNGQLYASTGRLGGATANQLYTVDIATAQTAPVGRFDSQNDYEGIVCPLTNRIGDAPRIQQVTINDGAAYTHVPTVTLTINTLLGQAGTPITQVVVLEYAYDSQAGQWRPMGTAVTFPVDPSGRYTWTLQPAAGVKYLHVWAVDAAGARSSLPTQAFISLVPATVTLAKSQGHLYRQWFNEGQSIHVQIDSLVGDADLAVWTPPDSASQKVWRSNRRSGRDGIQVVAPISGLYQIEVRGYSEATYQLSIGNGTHILDEIGSIDPDKPWADTPLVEVESAPTIELQLPTSTKRTLFLPLTMSGR